MDSSSTDMGDDGKAASAAAAAVNDDMLVKTETTPDINLNDNDALSQLGRENNHPPAPPPPPPPPLSHSSPSVADNNNNNNKVDEEMTDAHTRPTNPPYPADNCQDLQPKSPNSDAHCTPNQPNNNAKTLSTNPDGTTDLHPLVLNDNEKGEKLRDGLNKLALSPLAETEKEGPVCKSDAAHVSAMNTPNKSFHFDSSSLDGYDSGTEEEQAAFLKEVESFYRDNYLEFKPPRFYKEELNLLKLWRAVIKLGGYEQVTSCKLWRQVGESFRPPKTCTTVSWTFRIFYEKALLEYEKHKLHNGELPFSDGSFMESVRTENQASGGLAVGSGRARRDAAARARKHWSPIIKDKNLSPTPKIDKPSKTNGLLKRKKSSTVKHAVHSPQVIPMSALPDAMVIDIGPPAEWVKINVQKTNDCFEIYALVPGLLREEVHVQSDPAGRLIISGQPEQMENPWGVTPFRKVVSLPCRIDPHQTSAVVTLHGQLFVRVPYEQSDT